MFTLGLSENLQGEVFKNWNEKFLIFFNLFFYFKKWIIDKGNKAC
jgi:hypothetical protein